MQIPDVYGDTYLCYFISLFYFVAARLIAPLRNKITVNATTQKNQGHKRIKYDTNHHIKINCIKKEQFQMKLLFLKYFFDTTNHPAIAQIYRLLVSVSIYQ